MRCIFFFDAGLKSCIVALLKLHSCRVEYLQRCMVARMHSCIAEGLPSCRLEDFQVCIVAGLQGCIAEVAQLQRLQGCRVA